MSLGQLATILERPRPHIPDTYVALLDMSPAALQQLANTSERLLFRRRIQIAQHLARLTSSKHVPAGVARWLSEGSMGQLSIYLGAFTAPELARQLPLDFVKKLSQDVRVTQKSKEALREADVATVFIQADNPTREQLQATAAAYGFTTTGKPGHWHAQYLTKVGYIPSYFVGNPTGNILNERIISTFSFGSGIDAKKTIADESRRPRWSDQYYPEAVRITFRRGRPDLFRILIEAAGDDTEQIAKALKTLDPNTDLGVIGAAVYLHMLVSVIGFASTAAVVLGEKPYNYPNGDCLAKFLIEAGDFEALDVLVSTYPQDVKRVASRLLHVADALGFDDMRELLSLSSASSSPQAASSSVPTLEPIYAKAFLQVKQEEDQIRDAIFKGRPHENPLETLSWATIQDIRAEARDSLDRNRRSKKEDPQRITLAKLKPKYLNYNPYQAHTDLAFPGLRLITEMPPEFKSHFVLAGGMVTNLILGYSARRTDYDIFLLGDKAADLLPSLLELWKDWIATVTRSALAITLKMKSGDVIQFVLRIYSNTEEILVGFDVDAAGCCFYDGQFWATHRCLYSLKTMELNLDISRMSSTYNQRLLKYSERKYFTVVIPVPITPEHQQASLKLSLTDPSLYSYDELVNFNWNHQAAYDVKLWTVTPRITFEAQLLLINTTLIGLLALYSNRYLRARRVFLQSDYENVGDLPETRVASVLKEVGDLKSRVPVIETQGLTLFKNPDGKVTAYKFRVLTWGRLDLAFSLDVLPRSTEMSQVLLGATVPRTVRFVRENPGSQHTASFHPVDLTWDDWTRI